MVYKLINNCILVLIFNIKLRMAMNMHMYLCICLYTLRKLIIKLKIKHKYNIYIKEIDLYIHSEYSLHCLLWILEWPFPVKMNIFQKQFFITQILHVYSLCMVICLRNPIFSKMNSWIGLLKKYDLSILCHCHFKDG